MISLFFSHLFRPIESRMIRSSSLDCGVKRLRAQNANDIACVGDIMDVRICVTSLILHDLEMLRVPHALYLLPLYQTKTRISS